jgi:hypothetical protein
MGHIQPLCGFKVSSLHYASLTEVLKQMRRNAFGFEVILCDEQIIQRNKLARHNTKTGA